MDHLLGQTAEAQGTGYSIGQVVYWFSDKAMKALPVIIHEEIHQRTITGNRYTYKVAVGPQGSQKIYDLSKMGGAIYPSISGVRQALSERFNHFIETTCGQIAQTEQAWYGIVSTDVEGGLDTTAGNSNKPEDKIEPETVLQELQNLGNVVTVNGNQATMQQTGFRTVQP